MSYDYRILAPAEWSDKVMGKDWPDLIGLPWLTTPPRSAHRRLLDDIFRPMGSLPKRVAYTDQEEAMIDFVETGIYLSLARDIIIDRITRKRNFVIADKVTVTCLATESAGDFARLFVNAGGVGSEAGQCRARDCAEIAEERAKITGSEPKDSD
jgi:LysR substrate binding domain